MSFSAVLSFNGRIYFNSVDSNIRNVKLTITITITITNHERQTYDLIHC